MPSQIQKFRWQIALSLLGAILILGGVIFSRQDLLSPVAVEVVTEDKSSDIRVEVTGSVTSPGVYTLSSDARIEDAIAKAGGETQEADKEWIEKYINKAAKLVDAQKIYIPAISEQLDAPSANKQEGEVTLGVASQNVNSGLININTASPQELEKLWGIGRVTAQKIPEYRPYSNIEELLTKGIVKKNVFEKIKNQITIY